MRGNTKQFNSKYRLPNNEKMINFNYNPNATIDSGIEIPFLDINNDGIVNEKEVHIIIDNIINITSNLTKPKIGRIKHISNKFRGYAHPNKIDVLDVAFLLLVIRANRK
tara:strand:- start:56 stop:382 length:327 start_codon:yes stop_codon:yes gene_type:complete